MVKVALRDRSLTLPVLPLEVLPMMVCDAPEEEARRWIGRLSDESLDIRDRATTALRAGALRHEALLRTSLGEARDAETKARLGDLVAGLPGWKAQAEAIRAHPGLLLEIRKSLPADWPDLEQTRRMIDAVHERLRRK